MKKLLFLILCAGLLVSCKTEVSETKPVKPKTSKGVNFSKKDNISGAVALFADSTFSAPALSLLLDCYNDQAFDFFNFYAEVDRQKIAVLQLMDLTIKVDSLLKREATVSVVSAGEKITSSTVKKWMKQNPKEAREVMSELLRTSPEIFEGFEVWRI